MAGVAKLLGGHVINKSHREVDLNNRKYKGMIFGLYFSSRWCPPCQSFTPFLRELYHEYHRDKNFQVIFISLDHDQKSFHDYYESMPWLALDFKDQRRKDELCKRFHVNEIPKLVLIDGDTGETICTNAKEQLLYLDVEGIYFPWRSAIQNSF